MIQRLGTMEYYMTWKYALCFVSGYGGRNEREACCCSAITPAVTGIERRPVIWF